MDLLKKLFYLLPKGDAFKLTGLVFFMLIAALLELVGIGMIPVFVSIIAAPEKVMENEIIAPFLTYLGITKSGELLLFGGGVLLVAFIVKSIYIIFFNYVEAKFIYRRQYYLGKKLMDKYMFAPYTFHLEKNSAEILRNVTGEIRILINVVVTNILKMTREGVIAVTIFLFLLVVEPLITLIVLLISGVGVGSFLFLTQKKVKRLGKEEQLHRRNMIQAVNQGVGGIKDARILNREKNFVKKFSDEALKSSNLMAYIRFIQQIPKPVVETSAVLGMMCIAGLMVLQGRSIASIIPILTLFAMAVVRLMPAVQQLSSMYTNLRYNMVSIEPIYEDMNILDSYRLKNKNRDTKEDITFTEEIKARNVTYSYPNSSEKALNGVSFRIKPGESVAFVGESGSGKTTLVDALLGLLDLNDGEFTVDGKNIETVLTSWHKNIGYIPQSIYLSDETLKENIAFGIPYEEIDDSRVTDVLRSAQLKELVDSLPKGLNTIVGENGTRLSGGQRQRIGIARALYHNPQLLVMDEATSALDNITEREVTKAIESLKGKKTLIIIAHRLTTVENCDTLFMMKNGKIIDSGSYEDLKSKNLEFQKMALNIN